MKRLCAKVPSYPSCRLRRRPRRTWTTPTPFHPAAHEEEEEEERGEEGEKEGEEEEEEGDE